MRSGPLLDETMAEDDLTHRDDDGISLRKSDHLDIVLAPGQSDGGVTTGLETIVFAHDALPEIGMNEIDLSTDFLGRRLRAPILISSMTGGPERSGRINERLAEAAQTLGIALAVGSQRIAIEGRGDAGLTPALRRLAPSVPILANIGGAQLVRGYGLTEARRAIAMIEADALIVHLNPLQEAVQAGGDRDWRGVLDAIAALVRDLGAPIVVKEVGAGLSGVVVRRLSDIGVAAIDVAGAGGTSWAAVEAARASNARTRRIAETFAGWGIPTAQAIREARDASREATIIGSGGLRTGLDMAKAIRLGADIVGQAGVSLKAADESTEAVVDHFADRIEELRIACFCTGSADLSALRSARLLD